MATKKGGKKARSRQSPQKPKPPKNREFWDTNAHTILILESLLRDANTPGGKFALKRALRIMRAIDDAQ